MTLNPRIRRAQQFVHSFAALLCSGFVLFGPFVVIA